MPRPPGVGDTRAPPPDKHGRPCSGREGEIDTNRPTSASCSVSAATPAAFANLYDRHSRLLSGLVLRIVRDRAEAEEIHAEGESDHGELHTDEGVEVLLVATASDYLPEPA